MDILGHDKPEGDLVTYLKTSETIRRRVTNLLNLIDATKSKTDKELETCFQKFGLSSDELFAIIM